MPPMHLGELESWKDEITDSTRPLIDRGFSSGRVAERPFECSAEHGAAAAPRIAPPGSATARPAPAPTMPPVTCAATSMAPLASLVEGSSMEDTLQAGPWLYRWPKGVFLGKPLGP